MNILDRLIANLARKRGVVLESLIGTTGQAGGDPPPREYGDYVYLSSAVYTCVTGRSDLLSSLPFKLYRLAANGDKTEVEQGRLMSLLQKVNPFWTFGRLIQMTEMSLGLWGAAYWFLERGESGRGVPTEIWWARPDHVEVVADPRSYIKEFIYRPGGGGNPIHFSKEETVWLRYPNPNNEFEPLSPLASARISADYGLSALQVNKKLFDQGITMGGFVMPKPGAIMIDEKQGRELEDKINDRFSGKNKAHRWGVLRFDADIKQMSISPRDAEFIGGMKVALEDICRVYRWPLDLVGGQRTYENYEAALRAAWTHAVLPEARFIAAELTEQLLPAFAGEADLIEFDPSDIEVLQEAQTEAWTRAKEQITSGAITINQWREEQGDDPLPWGDVWWAASNLMPVSSPESPTMALQAQQAAAQQAAAEAQAKALEKQGDQKPPKQGDQGEDEEDQPQPPQEDEGRTIADRRRPPAAVRAIQYGSPAHKIAWRRFARGADRWEREFKALMIRLWKRQLDAVINRLNHRSLDDIDDDPFDLEDWIARFADDATPLLGEITAWGGEEAFDLLGIILEFQVNNPRAVAFIKDRAQRFAKQVNQTTWEALRSSIAEGIDKGESLTDMQARIKGVFEAFSDADPAAADKLTRLEMIARTETIGALNGGTLEGYRQSGLNIKKAWLADIDHRTRESHIEAHNKYQDQPIPVDQEFEVGGGAGLAPGQIGLPEEDINCRCTLQPIVEPD